MTRGKIDRGLVIQWAREAGFQVKEFAGGDQAGTVSVFDFGDVEVLCELEYVAERAAAAEREACAKVCDHYAEVYERKREAASLEGHVGGMELSAQCRATAVLAAHSVRARKGLAA